MTICKSCNTRFMNIVAEWQTEDEYDRINRIPMHIRRYTCPNCGHYNKPELYAI